MNQPGPAAYLAAMRRSQVDHAVLVQIDLTIPSSLTLRFASRALRPIDGEVWEDGLSCDPLTDAVEYLGPGPNLVSWQIYLANRVLSSGVRLDTLLHSYQWRRAVVTAWSIELNAEGVAGTFANAVCRVYRGRVLDTRSDSLKVELPLTQEFDWDVTVPDQPIDLAHEPNAPDSALGLFKPIVIGYHGKPALIDPFSSTEYTDHDQSGGGRLAIPLITTDPGSGADDVKAIAAGHLLKKLFDPTDGHSAFMPGVGPTLSPIGTPGVTETLGASESYLEIEDGKLVAYAAIIPNQVATNDGIRTIFNSADGPRFAMTPFNLSQYASIDQGAGKTGLMLTLPNVGSLGNIISVEACIAFSQSVNNPVQKVRIRPVNTVSGAAGTSILSGTALGTGGVHILRGTWDTGFYNANWQFGDGGTNKNAAILVDYDGVAGQKASIYWAVLIVKYAPARTLVGQTNILGVAYQSVDVDKFGQSGGVIIAGPRKINLPYLTYFPTDVLQLNTPLYANAEGVPDDGGGSITGSAAALIEKVPDVVSWLLQAYGDVSSGDLETGTGEHGSFVDMRATSKDCRPGDFKVAPYIGRQVRLSDAIKDICNQGLFSLLFDRFTDTWRMFMWKLGARADYDFTFTWATTDIVYAESLTNLDSVHEVRVQYGYDHYTGRMLFETFVGPDGSSTGYSTPTTRDQRAITIDASNDKVGFKLNASAATATLAHATYTNFIELAKDVRDKMNTASGTTTAIGVGYGFYVKASYNDALKITVGGTPYTATMNEGQYRSGDEFAIEVQRALNACGSGLTFTVVYVPSSSGFTISAGSAWAVADDGSGHLSIGWATVGYAYAAAAATSRGTDFPRYVEHFWWQILDSLSGTGHATITLLFGSGAAANPAFELGFARADGSAVADQSSTFGRGVRETVAASALSDYGPHRPDQFAATVVNDELTAVRIRNRRFDLRTIDRVMVVFRTTCAPDLQRMRKIQFDASVDAHRAFPRYGSDGSWAGKVFVVLSVTQYLDSQTHQEIVAIEA